MTWDSASATPEEWTVISANVAYVVTDYVIDDYVYPNFNYVVWSLQPDLSTTWS
jgi:hypothetical protein